MSRRLLARAARSLRARPSLEVHIPISPTPTFFNMVHCLTLSLRRFGGAYRDAPIVLTAGDETIDPGLADRYPWLDRLGVDLRWVPEAAFREHSYYATGAARFHHDYRSDVVLFLDADILVAAPFDELIRDVHRHQHFAGMIAQASPLQPPTTWQDLFDGCGVGLRAELTQEHVGFPYYRGGEELRHCPPYFNYGVVCAPAAIMRRIGGPYFEDLLRLLALTGNDLAAQAALTTAIVRLGIPWKPLPVRYNFPNHPAIEALHAPELRRAKFLHLKDEHQISKDHVFADPANIRDAVRRTDLRGVNEIARRVLEAIEPDLSGGQGGPSGVDRRRVDRVVGPFPEGEPMSRRLLARAARSLRARPSLEVHIPISPTPEFFSMVQCLARSLRKFGGAYRDAPIVLTVGDETIDPGLADRYPWLARLGVDLRWVPEAAFREHSYYATGTARFGHDYRSDVVLFLDADILVAAPFDELIDDVHRGQHFAGMIALASPMLSEESPPTWQDLYDLCGIAARPDLRHEYTGWPYFQSGDPAHRYAPPYFNYGVVCAPAALMRRIGPRYFAHYLSLRDRIEGLMIGQIALTMALVELAVPYRTLPMRYNFANDVMLEALHGPELPHARFLHLHGKLQVRKEELYADLAQIRATIRRTDLRGVARAAQRVLAAIEPDLVEARPAAVAG